MILPDSYPCSNRSGFILPIGSPRKDRLLIKMDPVDFLSLAAGGMNLFDEPWQLDEDPGAYHNEELDPLMLWINPEEGKVTGHEGRHRAFAAHYQGHMVPVLLIVKKWEYASPPVLDYFEQEDVCNLESQICRIEQEKGDEKVTIPFRPFEDPHEACRDWRF